MFGMTFLGLAESCLGCTSLYMCVYDCTSLYKFVRGCIRFPKGCKVFFYILRPPPDLFLKVNHFQQQLYCISSTCVRAQTHGWFRFIVCVKGGTVTRTVRARACCPSIVPLAARTCTRLCRRCDTARHVVQTSRKRPAFLDSCYLALPILQIGRLRPGADLRT